MITSGLTHVVSRLQIVHKHIHVMYMYDIVHVSIPVWCSFIKFVVSSSKVISWFYPHGKSTDWLSSHLPSVQTFLYG